jgi:uncharacterized membrane protein
MTTEPTSVPAISKSRLEFLFDGVFAIAMTILVLELKVPELVDRRSTADLARALVHEAPPFVSYLISFVVLGMFWYRHNQQYHNFRVITRGMLVLHFVQLAAAAFFPFCAALVGAYPTNGLSLVFYLACILVYAWASFATWVLARTSGATVHELTAAAYSRSRDRWFRACLVVSSLFVVYLIRALTQ